MRLVAFILTVLLVCGATVSAQEKDIVSLLDSARLRYDLDGASAALDRALNAAESDSTAAAKRLVAQAVLLTAELRRIEWETIPETDFAKRRPLGNAIDQAAEAGLRALDTLPPDSEVYRLRADLLAVMIRSDYRAKKYRKQMEEAAAKAVELDPMNARAYVSQAKPYVFAESHQGGDLAKAIALLTKALDLDPELETARCLRGLAYKRSGDVENARADWSLALEKNPHCRPAEEELGVTN